MGNDASSTLNLSDLVKSQESCDVSSASDIMKRLGIEIPGEFTKSEQNDDEKSDDNNDDDALLKYLNKYLDELSDDQMTQLFIRFGVTLDKEVNDKKDALMMIASNDYWRKNWSKHPMMKRVKNWLFVHEKYRQYLAEMVKTSSTDFDAAKNLFIKFDKKLKGHTDFEENMLLKFMRDSGKIPIAVLNELQHDHSDEMPKLSAKIVGSTKEEGTLQQLLKEYESKTLQHLEFEEQNVIHVWLNLNEEEYKRYRDGLSWKYAAVY